MAEDPGDAGTMSYPPIRGAHIARATPPENVEDLDALLHPAEAALARHMPLSRQPSFIAGRSALRDALRSTMRLSGPIENAIELNPAQPLLRTTRGAPLLPAGYVGSISHKRTLAVALVAPHRDHGGSVATVGIDLEERPTVTGRTRDIASRVLTFDEQRSLPGEGTLERVDAVLLHFAVKEAVYKAIDPYVNRYVRFTEVVLQFQVDVLADRGAASVRLDMPEFANEAPVITAEFWRDERWIIATAYS